MTMDAKMACKKRLGKLTDPELGSLRVLNLPNSWNHLQADRALIFRMLPIGPQETLITTWWPVPKDANPTGQRPVALPLFKQHRRGEGRKK